MSTNEKRFKKLMAAFPSIAELARLMELDRRTLEYKRDGERSVKKIDILAIERMAQINNDHMLELLARELCRVHYWAAEKVKAELDPSYDPAGNIEDLVESNYTQWIDRASKLIDKSVHDDQYTYPVSQE